MTTGHGSRELDDDAAKPSAIGADPGPTKAWVLWYQRLDAPGAGVMRAYDNEARAKLDMALFDDVAKTTKREYKLTAVPLFR